MILWLKGGLIGHYFSAILDLFTVHCVLYRVSSGLSAIDDPLCLLLAAALLRENAAIVAIIQIISVKLLAVDLLAGLVAEFPVIVHQSKARVVRDQAQLHLLIAVFYREVPKLGAILSGFLLFWSVSRRILEIVSVFDTFLIVLVQ